MRLRQGPRNVFLAATTLMLSNRVPVQSNVMRAGGRIACTADAAVAYTSERKRERSGMPTPSSGPAYRSSVPVPATEPFGAGTGTSSRAASVEILPQLRSTLTGWHLGEISRGTTPCMRTFFSVCSFTIWA